MGQLQNEAGEWSAAPRWQVWLLDSLIKSNPLAAIHSTLDISSIDDCHCFGEPRWYTSPQKASLLRRRRPWS